MTRHMYFRKAVFTAARITALRPGASPPPVQMPMQRMSDMREDQGTVTVNCAVGANTVPLLL